MLKRSFGTVKVFSLDRPAIRRALEDLVEQRYRPDPNVAAVYLFGSFARGTPSPGAMSPFSSCSAMTSARRASASPTTCRHGFPVGMDVIPWTQAELDERLAAGDRMAHAILAEGQALFDRRDTSLPRD